MRIVFDTNVLISGTLKKNSPPAIAFIKAAKEGSILYSIDTLEELSRTLLHAKFDRYVSREIRLEFLFSYKEIGEAIVVEHKINICRDAKDNMYLELALSGRANCIVSGDKDLLSLHPFGHIPVLNAFDFLNDF